jgi:hypothetical protein
MAQPLTLLRQCSDQLLRALLPGSHQQHVVAWAVVVSISRGAALTSRLWPRQG